MPSLRRGLRNRRRRDNHRPEVVTGKFELHYEDIVHENKLSVVAIFAAGLVLLAVFIPGAVYKSMADTDHISIEVEAGEITNADLVTKVQNDLTSSGNEYIEFHALPTNGGE